MEKMLISGVATDKNIAKISVSGMKNDPESTFKLLNLMAGNNLNIDVMIQSLDHDGTKTLTFTVARADMLVCCETTGRKQQCARKCRSKLPGRCGKSFRCRSRCQR